MTDLRKQLESARDAYRDCQYPDDLASQVLPPASESSRPNAAGLHRRWMIGSIAAGALAAAASILLLIGGPLPTSASLRVTPRLQAMRALRLLPAPVVNVPELPRYFTVAPPLQRLIPQGIRDLFMGNGHEMPATPDQPMSAPSEHA